MVVSGQYERGYRKAPFSAAIFSAVLRMWGLKSASLRSLFGDAGQAGRAKRIQGVHSRLEVRHAQQRRARECSAKIALCMGDWRGTERVYTLAKEQADPQQAQKNKKLVPSSSNYLGPIGGTTSEERPIQIQNVCGSSS